MRWLDDIIDSTDMSLSKLLEIVKDGILVCCGPWGCIELDMTERLNNIIIKVLCLLEISPQLPISATNFVYILHACMLSCFSHVRLFAILRTVAH